MFDKPTKIKKSLPKVKKFFYSLTSRSPFNFLSVKRDVESPSPTGKLNIGLNETKIVFYLYSAICLY